uniref:BppU N-terminal domain-containing protein n=1 Tax=biofilter metagenome TaxID=1070537 RepID=A0A193SBP1_9ZZZZ
MSNDTVVPAKVTATIYAGATFRRGWLRKVDSVDDDYTGCTAVVEIRDGTTNDLLTTLSTDNGGINFEGGRLELYIDHTGASALTPFASAIGHVEVRRPWGDVERLYEVSFSYSAQKTEVDPPELP